MFNTKSVLLFISDRLGTDYLALFGKIFFVILEAIALRVGKPDENTL